MVVAESLEELAKLPRTFSKEVKVDEDGRKIVYRGTPWGLHFDGLNIKGGFRFEKIDGEKLVSRLKMQWPPQIVKVPVENVVWNLSTRHENDYFVESGNPSNGYRDAIKAIAAEDHTDLSSSPLESVFADIDGGLTKFYTQEKASRE